MATSLAQKAHPEALLQRAAWFHLLAMGFWYPWPGHGAALLESLRRAPRPPGRLLADRALRRAFSAVENAWDGATAEGLRIEYARLFLGASPAAAHETAYGDARRIAGRVVELADVSGFYTAFGFKLSEEDPGLPDHLATELEFYSLLLLKQADAASASRRNAGSITRQAASRFMDYHLGRWVSAFQAGLIEHHASPAYRTLGVLLSTLVGQECRCLRIAPRLLSGRLPTDFVQEDGFECPQAVAPS
ncbi:MAG: molecular chaperone TorD family protein [Pseudomonadota bacterium]